MKINEKTTVNASVWAGGNPEGFLIHVISAIGYIVRSKLFESWVSYKTQIDKYTKDAKDTRRYIAIQVEELKKVQKEAIKATPAPMTDEEGMTITPAISRHIVEKLKKSTDDLESWKGHHKNLITEIQSTQEEKRKAGDAIFALYKNLLN